MRPEPEICCLSRNGDQMHATHCKAEQTLLGELDSFNCYAEGPRIRRIGAGSLRTDTKIATAWRQPKRHLRFAVRV